MKLLCTVSKILMCWKLCHETPVEDGLRVESFMGIKLFCIIF